MRRLAIPLAAAICAVQLHATGPVFYPDDPIAVDPETEDASGVQPWNVNDPFDFVEHTFFDKADDRDVRALNVNTIDEVPDSSWFTNRLPRELTPEAIVRAPYTAPGPADGTWTIISAKVEGRSPGFVVRDSAGATWFIKLDPPSNPEMASGAEVIATRFLHAFGYHVPENHVAIVSREQLAIDPSATTRTPTGSPRAFDRADLDAVLARSAVRHDGRFRALASRRLPGVDLGPFRYAGTRPDDPNDIYPHEHRRELRGMRVFAAWLNHDDSRSVNTRDTLVERDGRTLVWHYLLDFGSTLGSGTTQAQNPRSGNEYLWETRPTLLTMLTFGFYVRPWITVKYPNIPSVGRFEASFFQPDLWKPDYPNPAFDNARDDDAFWAARRLARLSDEAVRAVVRSAEYSDPRATDYLANALVIRRDKILARWLNGVLPLVDCAIDEAQLTCRNEALDLAVAQPATAYRARWFRLDNETGLESPVGAEITAQEPRFTLPPGLEAAAFAVAELRADHPVHASWSTPLRLSFRRTASRGWTAVGVVRR